MDKNYFIDPKWSLPKVQKHLQETIFSAENIKEIENIMEKNALSYKRQYLRWLEDCGDEMFCIFDPIKYKGEYPTLVGTPYYTRDGKQIHIMYHTYANHGKYRILAALNNKKVVLYAPHCVDRYEQRFYGRLIPIRDVKTAGEMLIYNNMTWECSCNENGVLKTYCVVIDGMYGCKNKQGIWMRMTLLTPDLFSHEQKKFYNSQLPVINKRLIDEGSPIIDTAA